MKYLLYCIFEKPPDGLITMPSPPEGHSIHLVEKEGLAAVFSEVSDREAAYDIAEIMRYHRVIEWFFAQVSVVPFRFGTLLDEYADVERLLERRAQHYKKILSELEGCVEVGIRAIIDEDQMPAEACCCGIPSLNSSSPGKLFLSSRRFYYRTETLLAEFGERVAQRYRTAFDGMFKRARCEIANTSVPEGRRGPAMVSMYFLVPRSLLPRFRQTFHDMAATDSAKSMLSGPWPPYNFVLPDNSPTA